MPNFSCYWYPLEYASENEICFLTWYFNKGHAQNVTYTRLYIPYFTIPVKHCSKFQKSKLDSINIRFTDNNNSNGSGTDAMISNDNLTILYYI